MSGRRLVFVARGPSLQPARLASRACRFPGAGLDSQFEQARLPSFRLGSCSVNNSVFALRTLARDW
jgi:hypothetical protein